MNEMQMHEVIWLLRTIAVILGAILGVIIGLAISTTAHKL